MMKKSWKTARRELDWSRPLIMGILNVTPDSFSDGGRFSNLNDALRHAEKLIADGADILDIGGESTRPNSRAVPAGEEIERVIPVVETIAKRFDTPVSIDTSKSEVAAAAMDAGAEIINDISGLRFDAGIANIAAATGAGLVLMHSRGQYETLHTQPPVDDIFAEVTADFIRSLRIAADSGITTDRIALDIGLGFGKTFEQNLDLIAKLDKIVSEFPSYPVLVGASRKSFIGRITPGRTPEERLGGSLAAAMIAAENGVGILRVHDVAATADALRVAEAIWERG